MLDFLLYFYLYDMIFPIIDLQITCPNLPHRKEKEKKNHESGMSCGIFLQTHIYPTSELW